MKSFLGICALVMTSFCLATVCSGQIPTLLPEFTVDLESELAEDDTMGALVDALSSLSLAADANAAATLRVLLVKRAFDPSGEQ